MGRDSNKNKSVECTDARFRKRYVARHQDFRVDVDGFYIIKKKKTGKNIHFLEDKKTAKKQQIKREICVMKVRFARRLTPLAVVGVMNCGRDKGWLDRFCWFCFIVGFLRLVRSVRNTCMCGKLLFHKSLIYKKWQKIKKDVQLIRTSRENISIIHRCHKKRKISLKILRCLKNSNTNINEAKSPEEKKEDFNSIRHSCFVITANGNNIIIIENDKFRLLSLKRNEFVQQLMTLRIIYVLNEINIIMVNVHMDQITIKCTCFGYRHINPKN
ncbi:hypothetical protein AGLY_009391 [Aphis glycines]|uniref:Uncharacterized protein n=1 Tax=Aphis glycines TaxID=307491 RepID=A0A6G0THE1_APHGL|nr:hypothetical protein AGLY_009391 [Aphis glycines]